MDREGFNKIKMDKEKVVLREKSLLKEKSFLFYKGYKRSSSIGFIIIKEEIKKFSKKFSVVFFRKKF